MAPESKATAAKSKGVAAAAPADPPAGAKRPAPAEEDKVPEGEISKMLSFLKRRSDPEKNKKGEGLQEARDALETYQSLARDSSTKPDFLSKLFASGKQNLKWVSSFTSTTTRATTEGEASLENFFYRSRIA